MTAQLDLFKDQHVPSYGAHFTKRRDLDDPEVRGMMATLNAARDAMMQTPEFRALQDQWAKDAGAKTSHDQPPSHAQRWHQHAQETAVAEAEAAAEQLDRDGDENERGEVAEASLPNDYIAGLNNRVRTEGRKACGCAEAHDFLIDSQGNDVTAQTCRQEDESRPSVGDLIEPGMIVETNYNTGPYMVASVSSYVLYGHYRCWSLSLIYPDRETGEYHDTKRDQRGAINELVADWSDSTPRFLKLFKANDDEVRIIGRGSKVDRKGQTSLL